MSTLQDYEFESLAHLLQNALSSEKSERVEAEAQIDHLAKQFEFLQHITMFVKSKFPVITQSQKLIALSVLKQRVNKRSVEEAILLVSSLCDVLILEQDIRVVKLSGAVVAVLLAVVNSLLDSNPHAAQCFEVLFNFVSENLKNSEHEWIRVNVLILLKELLAYQPSSSSCRECIVYLTLDLINIAVGKTVSEANCMSIEIVNDVFLTEMKNKEKNFVKFLKDSWEGFLPLFVEIMLTPCSVISVEGKFKGRLCMEIMKLFEGMVQFTAKSTIRGVLEAFLRGFLICMEADCSFYFAFQELCVNDDGDDDPEVILLHQLLAKRWDIFVFFLRIKSFRRLIKDDVEANQELILGLILNYTSLCDKEIKMWCNDASAFLRQEEEQEDNIIRGVRGAAADACHMCVSVLGINFLWLVFNSLSAISESDSWKKRESCLFLFDVVLQRCSKILIGSNIVGITPFLHTLLEKDVKCNPILAARALSVLGHFLFLMRKQQMDVQPLCYSLLHQAVSSLESSEALLRAAACKLLQKILTIANINDVQNLCVQGQQALFTLILNDTTKDELLYIGLEVCTEWISRCHSEKKQIVMLKAHEALITAWRNHIQDPNIGELVVQLFGELITEESGDQSFIEQIPWMSNILQVQCNISEYCAVPFVIENLERVFEKGSDNVTAKTAECLLCPLCKLLLTTDESSILVSASNCLAALLRRCPQASTIVVSLAPSVMKLGLHTTQATVEEAAEPYPLSTVLVTIVSSMLRDKNEVTLMNIGKLLSVIARNADGFGNEEMSCLITTIITRLLIVRTDTVSQELIAPLAILLKRHMVAFLHVVLTANLLVEVFSVWLSKMSVFLGKEDLLQSCDALVDLLFQWPPDDRLDAQMLPWGTGKRKHLIPLNLAIFIAVNKGILNLSTQLGTTDDDDDDDDDDGIDIMEKEEWPIDDDGEDEDDDDKEMGKVTVTEDIPHEMWLLLQRLQPLLSQYGSASTAYFSRVELDELNDLLTITTQRVN